LGSGGTGAGAGIRLRSTAGRNWSPWLLILRINPLWNRLVMAGFPCRTE
jgi:hypothetical protein